MYSRYEWDEAKRRRNVAKHGLDFAAFANMEKRDNMADGYEPSGLTPEELAALPPYEQVAGLTFVEIEALYDEETAINVGIATDPDAWIPTDEEWAQARPAIEVDPQLVKAWREGKLKMSPRPPVTKVCAQVTLDSDIVAFFEHLHPHWQDARLNAFLRAVIFRQPPEPSPAESRRQP